MSNSPTVPGAGSGGIRSLLMQRMIKVCLCQSMATLCIPIIVKWLLSIYIYIIIYMTIYIY